MEMSMYAFWVISGSCHSNAGFRPLFGLSANAAVAPARTSGTVAVAPCKNVRRSKALDDDIGLVIVVVVVAVDDGVAGSGV